MKKIHTIAWILLIVGGLNWGLQALGFNVVEMLLGSWPMVVSAVYLLVGASAVYELFTHRKNCKECTTSGGSSM